MSINLTFVTTILILAIALPVMLIVLGRGKGASFPRAYRRPLEEIVKLDRFDGAGLQGHNVHAVLGQ